VAAHGFALDEIERVPGDGKYLARGQLALVGRRRRRGRHLEYGPSIVGVVTEKVGMETNAKGMARRHGGNGRVTVRPSEPRW